jgi:hypothetical protein
MYASASASNSATQCPCGDVTVFRVVPLVAPGVPVVTAGGPVVTAGGLVVTAIVVGDNGVLVEGAVAVVSYFPVSP